MVLVVLVSIPREQWVPRDFPMTQVRNFMVSGMFCLYKIGVCTSYLAKGEVC